MVIPFFLTSEPEMTHVTFDVSSQAEAGSRETGVESEMAMEVRPIWREPDHWRERDSTLTWVRNNTG